MASRMPAGHIGTHTHSAGYEAPLQALAECHGRLQSQCAALLRLKAQVETEGASETARAAAGNLRRHFDKTVAQLHQDEEQDLFPALLESMAGSDAVCLRQMIDARAAEHREIELRWLVLWDWLERVEADYPDLPEPGAVDSFVALYRGHLEQEDQELLPMAERLLTDSALAQIGDAMRLRHGGA